MSRNKARVSRNKGISNTAYSIVGGIIMVMLAVHFAAQFNLITGEAWSAREVAVDAVAEPVPGLGVLPAEVAAVPEDQTSAKPDVVYERPKLRTPVVPARLSHSSDDHPGAVSAPVKTVKRAASTEAAHRRLRGAEKILTGF